MLVYALAGALLSAGVAGAYQCLILVASGIDPRGFPAQMLALEVMRLPAFATFGALTAAIGAALSPSWDTLWWRFPAWLALGAFAGVLVGLGGYGLGAGRLPHAVELLPLVTFGNKYVVAGLGMGAGFAAFETLAGIIRRLRRPARGPTDLQARDWVDFDAVSGGEMRRRAEAYLARRGKAGPPSGLGQ